MNALRVATVLVAIASSALSSFVLLPLTGLSEPTGPWVTGTAVACWVASILGFARTVRRSVTDDTLNLGLPSTVRDVLAGVVEASDEPSRLDEEPRAHGATAYILTAMPTDRRLEVRVGAEATELYISVDDAYWGQLDVASAAQRTRALADLRVLADSVVR